MAIKSGLTRITVIKIKVIMFKGVVLGCAITNIEFYVISISILLKVSFNTGHK